jgi:tetratricopeptide (TPR) repeat protein
MEGAIALALQYRDQASEHADDLLSEKQEEAEQLRQDMIDIAQTYAANAATALLNFDHAHAAELYGKAYEAVAQWDDALALAFKTNEADALSDLGYYRGDNAALVASLEAYNEALALAPQGAAPAEWAKLQDRVGQASQTLGIRLTELATLQSAIGFYEAALTVRTEAAMPEDWAKTQNNLANAYYSLGERAGDPELLRKAVGAFDASLRVFTPEAEPVKWATVANNRGAAQLKLAELIYTATDSMEMAAAMAGDPDPTNIPEVKAAREQAIAEAGAAIVSLEAAAEASSRADNPLDWAMLQHTLGSALHLRGDLTKSAEDLQLAVERFHVALEVYTRDRTPAQWVRSSNNLAISLKKLSDFTSDPAPLKEAIATYRAVLEGTSRDDMPLDWAAYQQNLGNALGVLAEYEDAVPNLDAALAAYRAAGEVITLEQGAAGWKQLQNAVSMTLLMHSLKSFDRTKAEEARDLAIATRDKLREVGAPDEPYYEMFLPMVEQVITIIPE